MIATQQPRASTPIFSPNRESRATTTNHPDVLRRCCRIRASGMPDFRRPAVCAARVAQPPRVNTDARMVPAGVVGDSISGKQGTREDGRPAGAGRKFMVATICAGRVRPAGVRAAVGAEKRGNARRAKGGREAEARERGGCHISRYRLPGRARKPEAKPAPIRREFACQHHRVAGAGGRSWITLRRGAGPCREATCQSESRVREIRTHGSEGGAAQTNASSLPLSKPLRRRQFLIRQLRSGRALASRPAMSGNSQGVASGCSLTGRNDTDRPISA